MNSQGRPRGSVLVVDDEPIIAEVVARYLDRAGYETRVACDGPQALQLVAEHRPDLVVLDVMLPGLGGLEVMSRLRDAARERTAVVLLTARGREADRISGLRLGADDYVVKPFSPAELVARVDHDDLAAQRFLRHLLRRARGVVGVGALVAGRGEREIGGALPRRDVARLDRPGQRDREQARGDHGKGGARPGHRSRVGLRAVSHLLQRLAATRAPGKLTDP